MPATAALVQKNVAPEVALFGVYVNAESLQIAVGVKLVLRVGVGLTRTVTFAVVLHPLAVTV